MSEHDPVNHPKHYTNHPSGIECIQITRHMGFNLGNVIKYVWRADTKNGVEDLEKAIWYLQDEIKKRTPPSAIPSTIANSSPVACIGSDNDERLEKC